MRDCEIRANSRWISLSVLCILIVDVNQEWFISRNFQLRRSSEESASPDAVPLTYLPRSHRGMFASRRQIGNAWFIDETCELWSLYEWRKNIYLHLRLMSVIILCQQTQWSLSSYKSDSTSFRFFISFLHYISSLRSIVGVMGDAEEMLMDNPLKSRTNKSVFTRE